MSHSRSDFDEAGLQQLSAEVIKEAITLGASSAEVGIGVDSGFSVSVRLGEVETVEFNRDKGVGVTVYFGQKKGSASSSDTSPDAIKKVVEKACYIARYTNEDPYSGLASKELMAYGYPDLDLYHPWQINTEQAIELALNCEQMALSFDKRIKNSEGSSVSTLQGYRVYRNSHGFMGAYPSSRHNISCMLIAEENGEMQRDYSFTVARDANDLESTKWVAIEAAKRTLRRLHSTKLKTCQAPVLFSAEVASGLLSKLLAAIRGSSIYRRSSFLLDCLDKQIFPSFVHIYEQPHLLKGLGSAPFDDEGVRTNDHDIVCDGILKSYLLSSYSARKLGLETTGNAGGVHNLRIKTSDSNLPDLLKEMGTGLYVTELIGQGVNIVTGDYSRGAAGFWVEHGEIQFPVHEITIASNLKDMFRNLVKIGNDVETRSNILTGSILIEQMMIAGQ